MDSCGEWEGRSVRQVLEKYVFAKGMTGGMALSSLIIATYDRHHTTTVPSVQFSNREASGVILRWAAQGQVPPGLLQLPYVSREALLSFFLGAFLFTGNHGLARNHSQTRRSTSLTESRSAIITTTRRTTLYVPRRTADGRSRAPARCRTRATGITQSISRANTRTRKAGSLLGATSVWSITGKWKGACSAIDICAAWPNKNKT